jgi:thiamine biosynthesis lipoprotein
MNAIEVQFNVDDWFADHHIHRFTHPAMATIFEIFIGDQEHTYSAQAAQAAFNELDLLEQELSRFIENSDIFRINQLKKNQSTIVGPDTFACLQACQVIFDETGGAFDISAGPLIKLWKEKERIDEEISNAHIKDELDRMGSEKLEMDPAAHRITLLADHVELDLGGYGKGYALDRMAEILQDWDIGTALLHGGRSTVLALESPENQDGWPLSISDPLDPQTLLETRLLRQNALSGSGIQKGSHIINPYTGYPVKDRLAAWAGSRSAALSDALSTAFMIMEITAIRDYLSLHNDCSGLIISKGKEGVEREIYRWDGRSEST